LRAAREAAPRQVSNVIGLNARAIGSTREQFQGMIESMTHRRRPTTLAELGHVAAFLAVVAEVRPDLHRYCARMTGSVADGEDLVQDTLAAAYYELSQLRELPALRAWLFRIAHNRPLEQAEAVRAAVSRFLELAPAQRSCVILKDVLEHSLEEVAALVTAHEKVRLLGHLSVSSARAT
jgi:hypothetical protein